MRSTQIDRKWPCMGRLPPITGAHPPKSLCSPRALLICFYRKHERYSFTGKFTIWSFESIGGPGSGDKRKTDRCHSNTSDNGSKSFHKTWWTFFLIRLFTITRKTNIINKWYSYITITELQQKQEVSFKVPRFFDTWNLKTNFFHHQFWEMHTFIHTSHIHANSGLNSVLWVSPQISLHWHLRFGSGFRRDGLMHYLWMDRGVG